MLRIDDIHAFGVIGMRDCVTEWSNIIFAKQMHHIAVGDALFEDIQGLRLDLLVEVWYNLPIDK